MIERCDGLCRTADGDRGHDVVRAAASALDGQGAVWILRCKPRHLAFRRKRFQSGHRVGTVLNQNADGVPQPNRARRSGSGLATGGAAHRVGVCLRQIKLGPASVELALHAIRIDARRRSQVWRNAPARWWIWRQKRRRRRRRWVGMVTTTMVAAMVMVVEGIRRVVCVCVGVVIVITLSARRRGRRPNGLEIRIGDVRSLRAAALARIRPRKLHGLWLRAARDAFGRRPRGRPAVRPDAGSTSSSVGGAVGHLSFLRCHATKSCKVSQKIICATKTTCASVASPSRREGIPVPVWTQTACCRRGKARPSNPHLPESPASPSPG